jgi:nucleotide-binding universal stress UspA family protein
VLSGRLVSIEELTMRHILVATDGSDGGDRALDFAAALAKGIGGVLSIVNVTDELSREDVEVLAQIESDLLDEMDNQVLNRARTRAGEQGLTSVHTHVGSGDPTAAILEAAAAHAVDAIVVGRRGRSQLTGLLLGSVSQKLASLSTCPVIVVP